MIRGHFIGTTPGASPSSDALDPANPHRMRCQVCGAWIDCRDLGDVIDHMHGEPIAAALGEVDGSA